jgi:hypothetical protein
MVSIPVRLGARVINSDRLRTDHIKGAIAKGPRTGSAPLSLRTSTKRRFGYVCAVGRMTISLTSTSAGCSMANAIARAIAAGGIAIFSIRSAIWAVTPGICHGVRELRVDKSRRNARHPQPVGGFLPQGLDDGAHGVLRASVDRHRRYDLKSGRRNDIDRNVRNSVGGTPATRPRFRLERL